LSCWAVLKNVFAHESWTYILSGTCTSVIFAIGVLILFLPNSLVFVVLEDRFLHFFFGRQVGLADCPFLKFDDGSVVVLPPDGGHSCRHGIFMFVILYRSVLVIGIVGALSLLLVLQGDGLPEHCLLDQSSGLFHFDLLGLASTLFIEFNLLLCQDGCSFVAELLQKLSQLSVSYTQFLLQLLYFFLS
jgi:hypothetical protein